MVRISAPPDKTTGIPCDTLTLDTIRRSGSTAVVEFHVGDQQYQVKVPPTALQSFARFQAAAFVAVGVWPRDWHCEFACDRAAVWADEVASAMQWGAAQ